MLSSFLAQFLSTLISNWTSIKYVGIDKCNNSALKYSNYRHWWFFTFFTSFIHIHNIEMHISLYNRMNYNFMQVNFNCLSQIIRLQLSINLFSAMLCVVYILRSRARILEFDVECRAGILFNLLWLMWTCLLVSLYEMNVTWSLLCRSRKLLRHFKSSLNIFPAFPTLVCQIFRLFSCFVYFPTCKHCEEHNLTSFSLEVGIKVLSFSFPKTRRACESVKEH